MIERNAERIFHSVQNGRCGAVHRQFANTFGAQCPVLIRTSSNNTLIGGTSIDVGTM